MNDKLLYILLDIIKKNGDIRRLKREGLDYISIAKITTEAIKNKLIIYDNNKISLSDLGEEMYLELDLKLKVLDKNKWIEPKNESRIPILEKDFVFLPKQDELHF